MNVIAAMIILPIEGFLLAIAIDILLGEPRNYIHVGYISGTLSRLTSRIVKKMKNRRTAGKISGILSILIILIPLSIIFYKIYTISSLNVLYVVLYAFVITSTFRITSFGSKLNPVLNYIEDGNLESAKIALSMIIGMDVTENTEEELNSRIMESIGNEFMEGVVGPLLYFMFIGMIGAIVYKIIATIRSQYRNGDRNSVQFSKFSEYSYELLSAGSSVISSGIILVSTFLLNYNVRKTPLTRIMPFSDIRNTGWVVGSLATSLNLRIEIQGEYILNGGGFNPKVADVRKAMRVYYLSTFIYIAFIVTPIFVIMLVLYALYNIPVMIL